MYNMNYIYRPIQQEYLQRARYWQAMGDGFLREGEVPLYFCVSIGSFLVSSLDTRHSCLSRANSQLSPLEEGGERRVKQQPSDAYRCPNDRQEEEGGRRRSDAEAKVNLTSERGNEDDIEPNGRRLGSKHM